MAAIGIDVTAALTQGGGIGRYTRELVRALAAVDAETEYVLFSAKPPAVLPVADPLPQADNFKHRPAPIDERWLYRLWYRLRIPLPVQLFSGRLSLFHSPDFVLPPLVGSIPSLLTVHDLSFVHFPEAYTPQLVAYLNRVVPWSVGRATHILADSQATKRDLIDLWRVADEKISVLYAGVSEQFQPVTDGKKLAAMRARYNIGDSPFLLAVGTVQPRKNYRLLIESFAPIARNWPHNLVIAGGMGWLYDDIMVEIAQRGLGDRVQLVGFVDDDDLPALYSAASLFLMPSLYEGFGIPLIEAMACGVPVIASDRSSLPEVVGDAGLLLPADEVAAWSSAIHRLLLDGPRRAKLVGRGAVKAQQFRWHKAATELLAVYERLQRG